MTKQNLKSILASIRALVMKSRPAYKDYLGEETVEKETVFFQSNDISSEESPLLSKPLVEGETYIITVDGVEKEMVAQDVSWVMQIIGGS